MRPDLLLSVLVVALLHTSSAMFPLPSAELAAIMKGPPPATNWLLTSVAAPAPNGLTNAQRTAWAKIGDHGRALHPVHNPAPTAPQPGFVSGPDTPQHANSTLLTPSHSNPQVQNNKPH